MHALRFVLLAAGVLALTASASPNQYSQRGTVATPRAARHDGQPMTRKVRLEGHLGTTVSSAIDARPAALLAPDDSGAAVTRHEGGGAVRVRVNEVIALGVEVDGAWSPSATNRAGTPLTAPDAPILAGALTVRASHPLGNGVALGWAVDLGAQAVPVDRVDITPTESARPSTALARFALVPTIRRGPVAVFGSIGYATDADVPAEVDSSSGQARAVVTNTSGALVVAAGATFDLGRGLRLSTRIGDAFAGAVPAGHYGPQVDVGLAVDVEP